MALDDKTKKLVEKFNRVSGGFSEEELKDINKERLRFMVKSKWFDTTGEEEEEFTTQVTDYLWKKLGREREERGIHTEIAEK